MSRDEWGSHPFHSPRAVPISALPVSIGYDDKVCRAIGAADPGAVPGGSTITTGCNRPGSVVAEVLMGPN